jgi:hypothetical protein
MTQLLETIFAELGIAQYLDAFLEQGFDTWETILDITQSDLYVRVKAGKIGVCGGCTDRATLRSDALGVKLGHRRVGIPLEAAPSAGEGHALLQLAVVNGKKIADRGDHRNSRDGLLIFAGSHRMFL